MSYLKYSLCSQSCKAAMAENDLDYPKLNVASIYDHYILNKLCIKTQNTTLDLNFFNYKTSRIDHVKTNFW